MPKDTICKHCKAVNKHHSFQCSKIRKPIKQKSQKKVKEDRVYSTLRKVFLESKKLCEAQLPGCTVKSAEVHHKEGRGIKTNNIKTWLAVCRNCHNWIELNPVEAKEKKLSNNRL